ncbi:DUF2922 domain-containing protein [Candidatus Enterococcus murrayae]|uniref:DUF2922 domain-containing protein n=1 Tax=Enterococcus TaxID=1350 RepID=UPI001F5DD9EF|nr:DUF2922 domain-containing protein [Enterococcus sp. MJM16]
MALKFEKSNGKLHRFSIRNLNQELSPEAIKAALEKLAIVDLFEKDGVGSFKKAVGAKLIETTDTMFYDENDEELNTAALQRAAALNHGAEKKEVLIRIPEDLIITAENPEPGILIRKIELPAGIDPQDLDDEQTASLLSACLPENPQIEDAWLEDNVFTLIEIIDR